MFTSKKKLQKSIDLGAELAKIQDIDILLDKVLDMSMELVDADAGSIYISEEGLLKFCNTKNKTLQSNLPEGKKLVYSTFTIPISDNSISGHVASTGETLNIKDVYELSSSVPYKFDKEYDRITNYRTESMLTIPLITHTGAVVGVLQLINAKDSSGNTTNFSKGDEPLVSSFAVNAAAAIDRTQLTRVIIMRMIRMAELRDPKETGAHVNRVGAFTVELYEHWATKKGVSVNEIEKTKDTLRLAAMLHDVGKVAISDNILKKPGRLDDDERKIMQTHAMMGARLFEDKYSDIDEFAYHIALNHHEWWDGSGYPGVNGVGKKGEEIHPFGRLVAITDVYDALCSKRSYKEPWDEEKVIETLKEDSGTQFDPEMVDSFIEILDIIQSVRKRYPD